MKAIFIPCTRPQEWCSRYFPGYSICSLPLAGKPAAEYFLDLCQDLHISKVRILDSLYQRKFAHYLTLHKNNYMPFSYHGQQIPKNFSELLKHHSSFCNSEDCLCFYGAVLPRLQNLEEFRQNFRPADQVTEDGIYLRSGSSLQKYCGPVYRLCTLQDYFELNFAFLQEKFYILPGYRQNEQTICGSNPHISSHCILHDNIYIGSRSMILSGCKLKHGVIIGHSTLIRGNTTLDRAIVFDQTYVPANLCLKNKIVTQNRIIDPFTGGQLKRRKMSGFCWNMETLNRLSVKFMKKSFALEIMILTLLPALIFALLSLIKGKSYHSCRTRFLARYAGLWQVLRGRRQLIHSYSKNYPPKSVFSLAGAYSRHYTITQKQLYGWHFTRHPSCRLILFIIWKNLCRG